MINDDLDLLRQYAGSKSEDAFATVVSRHVNLVYSVALRMVRDPQLAEEITQTVFIILARKAGSLSSKTIVSGWLCQTARYASAKALTIQRRRQLREHEAYMNSQSNAEETDASAWLQIEPLLDQAMEQLGEKDHAAVVLRFFEGRPFAEVSAALGTSEAGAKMRVNRALEKLRRFFGKRKIALSATVIAGAVSANSVQAAPLTLAQSATSLAIAHGAAASSSTLTLLKGTLKLMAWTKIKTAAVVGVVVLAGYGAATVAYKEIMARQKYSWQVQTITFDLLYQTPPQVKIVPTIFNDGTKGAVSDSSRGIIGIAQSIEEIAGAAYERFMPRIVIASPMPTGKYDVFCKLAQGMGTDEGWKSALQKEVKSKFGVIGHLEKRVTDVLILKTAASGTRGFEVSRSKQNGSSPTPIVQRVQKGMALGFAFSAHPITVLVDELESDYEIPVIDRTGLTQNYDFKLTWNKPEDYKFHGYPDPPSLDELKQVLGDQLGLELVPGREPIEMLVLERTK